MDVSSNTELQQGKECEGTLVNLLSENEQAIVRHITDLYSTATGLDSEYWLEPASTSPEAQIMMGNAVQTGFCQIIRSTNDGCRRCHYQATKAGRQSFDLGQPYVYVCHAGLIEWAVPIVQDQKYLGVVVAGRLRLWDLDTEMREELGARTRDLGIDADDLWQAMENVPYMSADRVEAASQLLFSSVCYHMGSDYRLLHHQKKLWGERSCMAEEIARQKMVQLQDMSIASRQTVPRKKAPAGANNGQPSVPRRTGTQSPSSFVLVKNEQELIGRIRIGDRSGAKEILNQTLGNIFLYSEDELDIVKARLFALLTNVGRAAVQKHTPWEDLGRLYLDAFQQLQQIVDIESLYIWTVQVFDQLMNEIYISRDNSRFSIVGQVIQYLQEHYAKEISVNDVARAVHLSPFYLSRIFKEELDFTIVEYLIEIRLSAARYLLENSILTVSQIAKQVGCHDPAYFSRIFKKHIGIGPKEYQRWWKTSKA